MSQRERAFPQDDLKINSFENFEGAESIENNRFNDKTINEH